MSDHYSLSRRLDRIDGDPCASVLWREYEKLLAVAREAIEALETSETERAHGVTTIEELETKIEELTEQLAEMRNSEEG